MAMTPEEKKYFELSEVYLSWYSDMTKPVIATGLAMGVIVEMESDLEIFRRKNDLKKEKLPEKVKNQINRLSILKNSVEFFDRIANGNFLVKKNLERLYDTNKALSEENEALKSEIEILKASLNGI